MRVNRFIFILPLIFLFSCKGPQSYIKTHPFVSMVDGKGQSEINGTIGLNRLEGMGSYSPIRYLDLRAQGFTGSLGEAYDFSLGLYHRMDRIRFALYGGIGRGDLKQTKRNGTKNGSGNDDPLQHVYGRFEKTFIQPELGFHLGEQIGVGLTARLSFVRYKHLRYSQTSFNGTSPRPEYILYAGRPHGRVLEPQFFMRFRNEKLTTTLQFGRASDSFQEAYPKYNPQIFSISIGVLLGMKNETIDSRLKSN